MSAPHSTWPEIEEATSFVGGGRENFGLVFVRSHECDARVHVSDLFAHANFSADTDDWL